MSIDASQSAASTRNGRASARTAGKGVFAGCMHRLRTAAARSRIVRGGPRTTPAPGGRAFMVERGLAETLR
ncbi:hypothetical protein DIJ62_23480 [Burkholderia pseudomallei]|nr:hypothetical protein DIJ62_23480 [Burkholderia pseudomallei]